MGGRLGGLGHQAEGPHDRSHSSRLYPGASRAGCIRPLRASGIAPCANHSALQAEPSREGSAIFRLRSIFCSMGVREGSQLAEPARNPC